MSIKENSKINGPILMEGTVSFRTIQDKAEVIADLIKMGFVDLNSSLVDTESHETMITLKYGKYQVTSEVLEFLKEQAIGMNLKLSELVSPERLIEHEYDDSTIWTLVEYAEEHAIYQSVDLEAWKNLVREHFFQN